MMQTQKVPPVFETNVTSNTTIVADQEAFFADATTPTHPPHRWIQAKTKQWSAARRPAMSGRFLTSVPKSPRTKTVIEIAAESAEDPELVTS